MSHLPLQGFGQCVPQWEGRARRAWQQRRGYPTARECLAIFVRCRADQGGNYRATVSVEIGQECHRQDSPNGKSRYTNHARCIHEPPTRVDRRGTRSARAGAPARGNRLEEYRAAERKTYPTQRYPPPEVWRLHDAGKDRRVFGRNG